MERATDMILFVDDSPDDRLLIERAFRKAGAHSSIVALSDVHEAVQYLKGAGKYGDRSRHPYPNFIMTDLKMPGADGFDLLSWLHAHPRMCIIPTIVFSASRDPDDVQRAYALGASSYHVKPSDQLALQAQVKIMHDYWRTCLVPEVDSNGHRVLTNPFGKLGERFAALPFPGGAPM